MPKRAAKKLTRKELFLKLDRQLSEAYWALGDALDKLTQEIHDILTRIFGKNFVLSIWWDWYRNGPTIFLKLNGSNEDRLGGADQDMAINMGYIPLSGALSTQLENIGMSWYHVEVFGHDYYMTEEDTDTFVEEFKKLINSQAQTEEEHV
jgi:hypothetical protein